VPEDYGPRWGVQDLFERRQALLKFLQHAVQPLSGMIHLR
jgi:hypothetical protein